MIDLKILGSALDQLEKERNIPKERIVEALETALAAAYKKDYGKKGQIVRASFDISSGKAEFIQVKKVVDESMLKREGEEQDEKEEEREIQRNFFSKMDIAEAIAPASSTDQGAEPARVRFNPEQHIMLEDAQRIKSGVHAGDEIEFPLEIKDNFGRIAAQTAKQIIIQKIREAERISVMKEFDSRQGDIVSGEVRRVERGNIFVDLDRATGIIPYTEQIPGEHYKQGERVRAFLYSVEETPKGINLRLSRSAPQFLELLFKIEAPEVAAGTVIVKSIAREPGSRSKIAVMSTDSHIDPVGSCVGQRGVRVSAVMSELRGEKIDIIEWSSDMKKFIEDALSPAKVAEVSIEEAERRAIVLVPSDQLSLAIGKGGQNVRLAAKLTGWKIDIKEIGSKEKDNSEAQETSEVLNKKEEESAVSEAKREKTEE